MMAERGPGTEGLMRPKADEERRGERSGEGCVWTAFLCLRKRMTSDDNWACIVGEETVRAIGVKGFGRWMMAGCGPDSRKMGARARPSVLERTVLRSHWRRPWFAQG